MLRTQVTLDNGEIEGIGRLWLWLDAHRAAIGVYYRMHALVTEMGDTIEASRLLSTLVEYERVSFIVAQLVWQLGQLVELVLICFVENGTSEWQSDGQLLCFDYLQEGRWRWRSILLYSYWSDQCTQFATESVVGVSIDNSRVGRRAVALVAGFRYENNATCVPPQVKTIMVFNKCGGVFIKTFVFCKKAGISNIRVSLIHA